jgi:DNA-binding transcriptional ArsR family regulator
MGHAVGLIDEAGAAAAAVDPLRRRILERLRETDTAASVARDLGLPRQRVNYHVRELERLGLVESVGERKKGNCVERLVRATSQSWVIAPLALGEVAAEGVRDRFSSSYVLAVASQTIRDVGELRKGADRAGKRLPTLSLQTEVRFAGPMEQTAFAEELSTAVAELVAKYHDEHAANGRTFRLNLVAYPRPGRAVETERQAGGPVGAATPDPEERIARK